ncbi:hypothetical protein ACQBAU_05165 [Propionibacteriaceae bacterium Y2011]|uniref:hypothetical protein n=1 Tax=Microlunatus sp. Y2014 TaxID=3418488 RepID=UPI003B4632F5
MQKLFKDIVAGDLDAVHARLAKDPGAVALTATAPPKKYTDQSPLQVAYRHGQFEIAELLLEQGADPNYIEHADRDPWVIPVLHHAIMAAVMRSRWLRPTRLAPPEEAWTTRNSAETADAAFAGLQLLLESGADIHAKNSYGGSALGRAAIDAAEILPKVKYNDPDWVDPKPLNPELIDDLTRIFDALLERGADPDDKLNAGEDLSVAEYFGKTAVARFLPAESQR